jgi:autotransporter-associated beta strand protein
LILDRDAPDAANMAVNVNAGVLEVRAGSSSTAASSLGASPIVTVNSGGVFQIDAQLNYAGGTGFSGNMLFGTTGNTLTLKNGSSLRSGNSGADAIFGVSLYGNMKIDNGASVTLSVPSLGAFALAQSVLNTTPAPAGANSLITVTGTGVVTLNGNSGTSFAYTGGWNINHGIVGNLTGQTYIYDYDAMGVNDAGYAAPVTLTSGFLSDVRSNVDHPVPNPITFTGGVLNAIANIAHRTDAYFSGAMNIQSLGGSTVDMSSTNVANLAGPVCNITMSGPVSGAGLLFITAPTTNPVSPGVLTFANTSALTPNTLSGNLVVQWNAALAATTGTGNSNPLGSATVTLAGGELRLNHAGTGSNGTIAAFAAGASNGNVVLRGYMNGDLSNVTNHDGTLTLGNALSGNTGNTIELNRLTFDAGGTSANQTLSVQNAAAGVNYRARFDGNVTLGGNATITTGASPADVIFNGKVIGAGNLIKAGDNTLTLNNASNDFTGSTTVNTGTLIFNATHRINALTINTGARAVVSSGGNKFLKATVLSVPGTLDLNDEDAILTATSLTTVKNLLTTGYNNGAWTGNGITSAQAAAIAADFANTHKTALAYATAQQINASTFNNEPVNLTDVLIRYTLAGDANLDGTVDSNDFSALATHFNLATQTWALGDFNFDGRVNALDFNAIAANYGAYLPGAPVNFAGSLGAVVPEPASTAAMILAGGVCLTRRRRAM